MNEDYVEGLTGNEIINDALDQLGEKLRGDCNLRESDAYPGGYDGWFEYHLNLHALDSSTVQGKVVIGTPQDDPEQEVIEGRIDIPLEPHLNVVRERSGQEIPTLAKDEDGKMVIKKRHYARRQA